MKMNIAKFFDVFEPLLWLINFSSITYLTVKKWIPVLFSIKYAKVSLFRVNEDSLCPQQRRVHS
jgi:hypothetical protein